MFRIARALLFIHHMLSTIFKNLFQTFSWLVTIAPWEQGLRVRFGKHITLLNAGVFIRIPFADKVYKQSIRRRLGLIKPQTLTTKDRHAVTCSGAVGYSVGDLRVLFDTLEAPNDTIENEVCALVSAFIGDRDLNDITSTNLSAYVMKHMDLSKYGLTGQEFYITSFAVVKTYRFITGDLSTWSHDSKISMQADGGSGVGVPY